MTDSAVYVGIVKLRKLGLVLPPLTEHGTKNPASIDNASFFALKKIPSLTEQIDLHTEQILTSGTFLA